MEKVIGKVYFRQILHPDLRPDEPSDVAVRIEGLSNPSTGGSCSTTCTCVSAAARS